MTSRERIVASLNHEEPDRIAIDFGSSRSSGINAIAYNRLKEYLNIREGVTRVYDVKQLLAMPEESVMKRLGCDVVQLSRLRPSLGLKLENWKTWMLPADGGECLVPGEFSPVRLYDGSEAIYDAQGKLIAKRPKDGLYFDEFYNPLENADSEADIDAFAFPEITEEELSWAAVQAKALFETTDYAISGATSFSLFEKGIKDFGYETFLTNIYEKPELIEYYLDKLTNAYIAMMDKYLDAVGAWIQIVQTNDDFGMQSGLIISPNVYREMFMPRHEKIIRAIKSKKKDVFVFLHSCGGIYPIIGDLIEAGFDIFNPVQINAAGMDPVRLKKEFGQRCTFWGGAVNTQTTLEFGDVADVVQEAREMIEIFAPGGGFVFTQVHNIQANVEPEKIVALYLTALNYGKNDNKGE